VKINGCDHNVQVRSEAVSKQKGTFSFYDTGDVVSNANSLIQTDRSSNKIEVNAISLDEFAEEQKAKIDCLKIDVEGAELDALEGAKNVFTKMRPVALLSLHPASINANQQSLESIWDLLKSYNMRVIYEGLETTKESFCRHDGLFDVNLFPA
jgi:FkbM family methyltransferase